MCDRLWHTVSTQWHVDNCDESVVAAGPTESLLLMGPRVRPIVRHQAFNVGETRFGAMPSFKFHSASCSTVCNKCVTVCQTRCDSHKPCDKGRCYKTCDFRKYPENWKKSNQGNLKYAYIVKPRKLLSHNQDFTHNYYHHGYQCSLRRRLFEVVCLFCFLD